jgi:hypothetical protein
VQPLWNWLGLFIKHLQGFILVTMKCLFSLLLLAGAAYAQPPTKAIRRDSLPELFPPDVESLSRMPNVRPRNSFYRNPLDPPNVVRATLDNMPIKVPDSSTNYTMLRSYQPYRKPSEPSMPFLKPMPRVVPKKFH